MQACRYFGVSTSSFYLWKRKYRELGEKGLINSKPCPENPHLRTPDHIAEKIIYLRQTYHFGPDRISMYMQRYHEIKVGEHAVRGVLLRAGLNRLPQNTKRRSPGPKFKRYEKQVPGHHVQVDVKFLIFKDKNNKKVKRYQYTAIDDATRARVLKIYDKHNQEHAIEFMDHVIERFPFRIKMVRTDNGHEFQAFFHWHLIDLGIAHVYIKKGTPRLNGKVERSHRTDQEEFYQLLHFTDDKKISRKHLMNRKNFITYIDHIQLIKAKLHMKY